MKKSHFPIAIIILIVIFSGCTVVENPVNKFYLDNQIDLDDFRAMGYDQLSRTPESKCGMTLGVGEYYYETTVNGTELYTSTAYIFASKADAEKKYALLSAGYAPIDTNYGSAAVKDRQGVATYNDTVVFFETPFADKTLILAQRFVEKMRKGVEETDDD